MTLAQTMVDDVDAVFLDTDEHAETITYTPTGSGGSSISAVVDQDAADEPIGAVDGKQITQRVAVFVATADVPTVTLHADTMTVRGTTYTVVSTNDEDLGMKRIVGETVSMTRKSRQDYERQR